MCSNISSCHRVAIGPGDRLKHLAVRDPRTPVAQNCTALMCAAQAHLPKTVKALVDGGADVHMQSGTKYKTATALHLAVNTRWGRSDDEVEAGAATVQALINGGCLIDAKTDNQWTALEFAATNGIEEAVKLLLAAGADPLSKDEVSRVLVCVCRCAAQVTCVHSVV